MSESLIKLPELPKEAIFLINKRKPIIIITIFGIIASVMMYFMADHKYYSNVVMMPTSTNSISKVLISPKPTGEDIMNFGNTTNAEQMIEILNSSVLKNRIISKYNLTEHYNISGKNIEEKTIKAFDKNITFSMTRYSAVKINVYDVDAQLASDIANDIADLYDTVKNNMVQSRAKIGFEIVSGEYTKLQKEVDMIVDSLRVLGRMGINDFESQSERINEQYAIALRQNDATAISRLEKQKSILAEYGNNYMFLKNQLIYKTDQITQLSEKYSEAKIDAQNSFPQKFVIDRAFPAKKTSQPKLSIMLIMGTLSAFVFAIALLVFIEIIAYFKRTKLFQSKQK